MDPYPKIQNQSPTAQVNNLNANSSANTSSFQTNSPTKSYINFKANFFSPVKGATSKSMPTQNPNSMAQSSNLPQNTLSSSFLSNANPNGHIIIPTINRNINTNISFSPPNTAPVPQSSRVPSSTVSPVKLLVNKTTPNTPPNPTASSASFGQSSSSNRSQATTQLESLIARCCLECDGNEVTSEVCVICTEELCNESSYDDLLPGITSPVIKLSECKHYFHNECLNSMIQANQGDFIKCPSCSKRYGEETGSQPQRGTMTVSVDDDITLAGYKCDTLVVTYSFTSGVSDGKRFSAVGFPRTGYFPANDKGRKVVNLLKTAFKRRLVFRIGTSCTTGMADCVIWNDIHHKTSLTPGDPHGYPDTGYLDRVLEELEAKGVY